MKGNFIFPFIFILFLTISIASARQLTIDYNNPLTRSTADNIYCMFNGICSLSSLIVENLTVTNYVNLTVTSYNVTGDMSVSGNVNAYSYYINGTGIYDIFVDEAGDTMTGDLIISNADLYARDGNFSRDVFIDDDLFADNGNFSYLGVSNNLDVAGYTTTQDLYVTDDVDILDTLQVYGYSDFYNDFDVYDSAFFNDSITLKRGGAAILEVETTSTDGSAEIRVLADGTNDLYIYTYGSTVAGTYYNLPKNSSSFVDARGERLVVGTFDASPLYLATHQDPRFIITKDGDLIPYDDDAYMLGNRSNRLEDIYVVGESNQGIHFVEDDGSYGNLSMDDNFNLLWNGKIINVSAIGTWNGSINAYTKAEVDAYISGNITALNESVKIWVYNGSLAYVTYVDATNDSMKDYVDKTFVKNGTDVVFSNGNFTDGLDVLGDTNIQHIEVNLTDDQVSAISTGFSYIKPTKNLVPSVVPAFDHDVLTTYYVKFTNGTQAGNYFLIRRSRDLDPDRFYFLTYPPGVVVGDTFEVYNYSFLGELKAEKLNITNGGYINELTSASIVGLTSLDVNGGIEADYYYSSVSSNRTFLNIFSNVDLYADSNESISSLVGVKSTVNTVAGFDYDITSIWVPSMVSFYGRIVTDSGYSGYIKSATPFLSVPSFDGDGRIGDLYGLYIYYDDTPSTKDVANSYGIYIKENNHPNSTWAIYSESDTIYSGGNIEIPDDIKRYSGSANDVSTYFNASDYIIKAEVGSPNLYFQSFDNLYFNNTRFCFENGTNCNITASGVSGDYTTKSQMQANLTALNNTVMETVYNGSLAYVTYVDAANTSMKDYTDKTFVKNGTDASLSGLTVNGNTTANYYCGDDNCDHYMRFNGTHWEWK